MTKCLNIRVPQNALDSGTEIALFEPTGAEYFNIFGENVEDIERNLIAGKPAGMLIGTPAAEDPAWTRFRNALNVGRGDRSYVETWVPETTAMTWAFVAKQPFPQATIATATYLASTFNGASSVDPALKSNGAALLFSGDTVQSAQIRGRTGATIETGSAAIVGSVVDDWYLIFLRCDDTEVTINNITLGTTATDTLANPRDLSALTIRIGGLSVSVVKGEADILLAGLWSVMLDDTQMNNQAAQLIAIAAVRGIDVAP